MYFINNECFAFLVVFDCKIGCNEIVKYEVNLFLGSKMHLGLYYFILDGVYNFYFNDLK